MTRLQLIFLISTLFSSLALQAQDEESWSVYADFGEGFEVALASDRVNVRKTPNDKGELLTTLPIGTPITVLKKTDKLFKFNGYNAPWYQVSFNANGKKQSGYIWGGFMTENVEYQIETKVQFVYNIESCQTKRVKYEGGSYTEESIRIQLRACKDGKELAKISFDAVGGLGIFHNAMIRDGQGLPGIENIVQVNFSEASCGGQFGDVYIIWTGSKFFYMNTLHQGFDYPYFSRDEYIFPKDEGGKPGVIVRVKQTGEYPEDADDETPPVLEEDLQEEYQWTGTALKKIK